MMNHKPSTQGTNMQNAPELNALKSALSGEGLQGLFTGKIIDMYSEEFKQLMNSLSSEFDQDEDKRKQGIAYISNYNYYKFVKDEGYNPAKEYNPLEDEYDSSKYELGMLSMPTGWVEQEVKNSCIKIVNHALELAGYGEYLRQHRGDLTGNHHDICCSVNYYYNREGEVGFHQDSLGIELFVLLIYFDSVNGPEWKLQRPEIFSERMSKISSKNSMPTSFIDTATRLHAKALQNQNVEWVDGEHGQQSTNIVDDVQWTGRLEGPGGIVGFVDELIIHSTPLIEHRAPNHLWLLTILEAMQQADNNFEDQKRMNIQAIFFLYGLIQTINSEDAKKKQKDEHYVHNITKNELEELIARSTEDTTGVVSMVEKLYALNEVYENWGGGFSITYPESNGNLLLGLLIVLWDVEKAENVSEKQKELIESLKAQIVTIVKEKGKHYINKSKLLELINDEGDKGTVEKLLQELYNKLWDLEYYMLGGDLKLARSRHQMHGMEDEFRSTKNIKRALSSRDLEQLKQQDSVVTSTGEVRQKQRSFLRVWVTALPKGQK